MAKKKVNGRQTAYLTKRILISSARTAGVLASKEAMQLMGHVVISHDGWVVRKYADGHTERITPIASTENLKVVLD